MRYSVTWNEIGKWLPYSRRHLYRLEACGKFPKRINVGPKRVAWLLDDIIAWADEQRRKLSKKRR
jgi:predicted DNA-binding transcriptional regulator AlpA